MSRSTEGQGRNAACLWKVHDLSNNVCEYEVNLLTNEKVIRGNRNFNKNCLRCRTNNHPPTRIHQSINWNFLWKIRLTKPSTNKSCTLKDLIVFILRLFCTFGTNSLCQLQRRMEENQHSDQSIFYLQINTLTSLYFTFRSTFGPVYILLQINTLTSLYFTFSFGNVITYLVLLRRWHCYNYQLFLLYFLRMTVNVSITYIKLELSQIQELSGKYI